MRGRGVALPRMGPPADAVAAPKRYGKLFPDRALLERAAAGREAIDRGADPALVLSLVVWPTPAVVDAARSAGRPETRRRP